MMIWAGLFVGIAIGAVMKGLEGAFVLGIAGWFLGLLFKSQVAERERRQQQLDARLQKVEVHLARLDGTFGATSTIETASTAQSSETVPVAPSSTASPTPGKPSSVAHQEPAAAASEEPQQDQATTSSPGAPPATPNPIMAWLLGGNTIARVGLLILFLGLGFLLKYAVEHSMVPPELRVAGVAAVGIALLALGWALRLRRRAYALGLQGGGVAVLYLVTFAALRLYALIPASLAFALLAAIAIFSAVLAVGEDALVLAVFGAGGGFLAPILASTGEGSHVALFSYYLLLNLGIAGIAFFRSWRSLNVMGFFFTFVIGTLWGWQYYRPEYLATTEPFLAVFFLLYVGLALLQARNQATLSSPYIDGMLVFGVPLAAFGLQAALMKNNELGLAYSCLAAAMLYLGLAAILVRRAAYRLLTEVFMALGVVFASIAIPFALGARWTSAAWSIEGAAVVWISLRQERRLAALFGMLLQVGAGVAFAWSYERPADGLPWLDAAFLGAALIAIAGLWTSRLLGRAASSVMQEVKPFAPVAFVWGGLWWALAGRYDVVKNLAPDSQLAALLGFAAASVALFSFFARALAWREASWPARAFVFILVLAAAASWHDQLHPFANFGWIAWPLAMIVHAWTLERHEDSWPAYVRLQHALGLLIFIAAFTLELHWWAVEVSARHTAWSVAAIVVVPALAVTALSSRAADVRWPVATHNDVYRLIVPFILGVGALGWMVYANVNETGRSDPLPYLPLLNALDLAHLLVATAVVALVLAWRRTAWPVPAEVKALGPPLAGVLVFLWLTAILLRTLHHWADVGYDLDSIMASTLAQASLSIFWTTIALALMFTATRRAWRTVWLAGAVLIAVVVVKLFLVELSNVGAVARIVSFTVVGLLMLAVGYAAPVPPRVAEVRS